MSEENGQRVAEAALQIPRGLFVLTTAFGGVRSGILTKWVQPCSTDPLMVMVAIAHGLPVEPLIRDSRGFTLCQIAAGDLLLERLFARPAARTEDPFFALPCRDSSCGAPIIERAHSYLDCQVVRHVDLDTSFRLFVGHVVDGDILNGDREPAVEIGRNGTNGTNGTAHT
jgi:flavin reductase (DIM6/NTAB) family NADH-FMN oxidoreductase RutF